MNPRNQYLVDLSHADAAQQWALVLGLPTEILQAAAQRVRTKRHEAASQTRRWLPPNLAA